MVMRKGVHFRATKLHYLEIGCPHAAAGPLRELGWVEDQSPLPFATLFALLQKSELLGAFRPWIDQPKGNKADWLEPLAAQFTEPRSFAQWCPDVGDVLYSLTVMELCDRLRLMFFGNLHQDWSEFVLVTWVSTPMKKSSSAPSLVVYAAVTTCMGFYFCTSASKPLKPVRHWIRCWRRSPRCVPTTRGWKSVVPSCCSRSASIANGAPSWHWPNRSTAIALIPARGRG